MTTTPYTRSTGKSVELRFTQKNYSAGGCRIAATSDGFRQHMVLLTLNTANRNVQPCGRLSTGIRARVLRSAWL